MNTDNLILKIHHNNYLDASEKFFLERSLEILNEKSIPANSLKYLNSHIAIKELVEVSENTLKEVYPTNDHFKCLLEECNKLIAKDSTFQYDTGGTYKRLLQSILNEYGKKENFNMLIQRLKVELNQLKSFYLSWIVLGLKDSIAQENIKILNTLCNFFISELVNLYGWSIKGIQVQLNKVLESSISPDSKDLAFSNFYNIISKTQEEYECYFMLRNQLSPNYISTLDKVKLTLFKGSDIIEDPNKILMAPSVKANNYYLLEKVKAYDFFAAVDIAWNSITSKLGILSFFDQNKLLINESALILINGNNTFFKKQITPTIFSSNYESKITLSELDKLYELDVNSQSKINNSLKFINNSTESKSLDTKFINQWVALESISSSNQYKSIFINISEVVNTMLFLKNIYLQLNEFYRLCKTKGINVPFDQNLSSYKNVAEFVKYILENQSQIRTDCESHSKFLWFRCEEIINIVKTPKDASDYIKYHRKKLDWHLRRLYRVRNSLAHAGNSNQNIILFLNHLNFYSSNLISELIYRMKKHSFDDVESVYAQMNNNFIATVDYLDNGQVTDPQYIHYLLSGFI